MAALSLHLLGPFTATLNDQPLHNFKTSKVQALLIYLAVEKNRPNRREFLFTMLWPGMPEKSARHNLNQTLYALRQVFPTVPSDGGGESVPLIFSNRQTIQFNPKAAVDTDTHQVDQLIKETQHHRHQRLADCGSCIQALEHLAGLYRGEFLSDFYLGDSNAFEEWAAAVREAYQRKLIDALTILADIAIHKGDYDPAINYIDRRLALEDLNERAHRQKIEVLALSGRRVEAMHHFREFEGQLEAQLGTSPSPETTALYERIRKQDLAAIQPQPEPTTPETTAPRHNLLPQPTPFIGRQAELARLDQMLRDPSIRLITITGPGGMGKTRLAIACAERQLARRGGLAKRPPFPDGIYFIPLEDLISPDQIFKEIATTLNLERILGSMMERREGAVDPNQMLREYLHQKQLFLILDNFEQFTGGGVILADLLQSAPSIQILVTSRERLNLQGEQVFPITGLSFPVDIASPDRSDFSAIQLFEERARRLQLNFEPRPGDLEHLTRICRLVDGMPLGLELAASWVDLLSVKEIAAEIQKSLDFLESQVTNIPTRHRSLRAVCNATWEYLNQIEQDAFSRLSVFRGGFQRAAAQEITGTALRILANLVKKSLLQYDPKHERYRIHPILRQFGGEQFAKNAKEEFQVRDAHSAFFCIQLEEDNQTLQSGQPHQAFERIEAEFPNIQAAWDWAVRHAKLECIDQGIDILCRYFQWNGRYQEGLRICQVVEQRLTEIQKNPAIQANRSQNHSLFERVHAKVLIWEGDFNRVYDPDQAKKLLAASSEMLTKLDKTGHDVRYEKALLLICKAEITGWGLQNADLQPSNELLQESISLVEKTENYWLMLVCFMMLGHNCSVMGDHQEARKWFERGYSIAKKQHNQHYEVYILIGLGRASRRLGDYEIAKGYFHNALSTAKAYQMPIESMTARQFLSDLSLFLGSLNESITSSQQSIALAKEKYSIQNVNSLTNLSVSQWLAGNFENAEESIETAVDITQQLSNARVIFSNVCLIELLALTGRYRKAALKIELVRDWSKTFEMDNWSYLSGRLAWIQGWMALVNQGYPEALAYLETSIEGAQFDDERIAWSQPYLALAHFRLGDRVQARKLLTEALSTSIEIQGYIPMVFTLPVTLLLLVEEDLQFAANVYTQVRRDPFMSKAQLFHDLVYKHLPEEITSVPVEMVQHSSKHRAALWDTARLVLKKWPGNLKR